MEDQTKPRSLGRVGLLKGFVLLSDLYNGAEPVFESKNQTEWFLRCRGPELVRAGALAIDRGRRVVHLERLTRVREEVALQDAKRRYGGA